ncbi:MAG: FeS-binding protein [Deltaproteobacteria bacterium CG_4_8_14_3_um_filter_51_11]|nr:MAG: FeS-binding protein [Deltaproteobacteria bacterium CG_4_8_14_3_um_filter_51_11]PJB37392.1 MAG: FeS-binding protein [Deltaproteobacteria bacterium CG_4_9_14_3_um_filter_51_14]
MSKPKVAIVKTGALKGNPEFLGGKFVRYEEDVAQLKLKIGEAISLAVGSIDNIVGEGETVLIKPNLAFQAPPESFSVVDPRVIEAMVSYLKENSKAGEVWVGDNPSLGQHVGRSRPAFRMSGMQAAAERGGADRVIFFDEEELVEVQIKGARLYKQAKIYKPLLDADRVINLPKMKTHLAGIVTLGVKNWQGIIPNIHPSGEQQDLHRLDLGQKCADLLRVREADLTLVDAVIGMEGQGPHAGTPVEMNLLIAGAQTVAVDAVASYVMGFETVEIPAVRIAAADGLGVREISAIEVVGTPISDVRTFFKRSMNDPVGLIPGIHAVIQQTCPGCFVNIRGALDNFNNNVDTKDFIQKAGEVYIVAGGVPQFDPEVVRDKYLFVTGDCWKLFPSRSKVEKAMQLAKHVTEYPGCAPVYIFAQLNGDLQALYQKCGGVLCPVR